MGSASRSNSEASAGAAPPASVERPISAAAPKADRRWPRDCCCSCARRERGSAGRSLPCSCSVVERGSRRPGARPLTTPGVARKREGDLLPVDAAARARCGTLCPGSARVSSRVSWRVWCSSRCAHEGSPPRHTPAERGGADVPPTRAGAPHLLRPAHHRARPAAQRGPAIGAHRGAHGALLHHHAALHGVCWA